jgi:hypothetical protein
VDKTSAFDSVKAHPTGTGPFVAEYERTIEEGCLHYLKDGLVLGHVQGLGDTGGGSLTNLDEAGHFRFCGTMELSGRNTTSDVHAPVTADPPSRSAAQQKLLVAEGKELKVEPVVLDKSHRHVLILNEHKVERGGFESLTSPFGGVSISPPDEVCQKRPYWKYTVQYDPDKTGFDTALLRIEGGGALLGEAQSNGLRLDTVEECVTRSDDDKSSSFVAQSLKDGSKLCVVAPVGHSVRLYSRPVVLQKL